MHGLWAIVIGIGITIFGVLPASHAEDVNPNLVPPYVTDGLETYGAKGYEAAVAVWLQDSPWKNATTLASSIAFFKNIEMLAGKYISYDILMTRQTISSNAVYVRMNFARRPGFILFISKVSNDKWVLAKLRLDRMQKMGTL